MELIRGLHNLRPRHRGCVVTIGAFDGVHLGHQEVLRHLRDKGAELGVPTTVVLFEPLPREFFSPLQAPPRLMSFREKVAALRDVGIDRVLRIRFDASLSEVSAAEFVQRVFVDGLGARHVVMGDDSHFGHNRQGDIHLLREMGSRHGFTVEPTPTLLVDGERVSSTRIRALLGEGDFAAAERLLGRPYSITGRVMVGQRLGRTLGVPTANMQLYRLRSPLAGVFAVEVLGAAATPQPGVANVGTRPTIGDLTRAILEVHLLNFSDDLYHRTLSVVFRRKLRDEVKFGSLDALKQQIHRDLAEGRHYFAEPGA